jgi:hypothetical protein
VFDLNLTYKAVRLLDGHTYVFVYPADSEPHTVACTIGALGEYAGFNPIVRLLLMRRIYGLSDGQFSYMVDYTFDQVEGEKPDEGDGQR